MLQQSIALSMLWTMRTVLSNVMRQYFKIIARYSIDERISQSRYPIIIPDIISIRKVSTFDLVYYITHLRIADENQSDHKAIQWRLSDGRFPMERRTIRCLSVIFAKGYAPLDVAPAIRRRISICEGGIAPLKGRLYQTREVTLRPSNALRSPNRICCGTLRHLQ